LGIYSRGEKFSTTNFVSSTHFLSAFANLEGVLEQTGGGIPSLAVIQSMIDEKFGSGQVPAESTMV
jgi:hypothetical protein